MKQNSSLPVPVHPDTKAPLQWLFSLKPSFLLLGAAAVTLMATGLNYMVQEVSLGAVYVVPMLLCSLVLSRNQILLLALGMSMVRMMFVGDVTFADGSFRFLLGLLAYSATGLFGVELVRNRRLILEHNRAMAEQESLRAELESHLRALADSSPAAIFTLDESAVVLSGNRAAAALLGCEARDLVGFSAGPVLPVLSDALKLRSDGGFRTAAQSQGRRANGDVFLAQTWFSIYSTPRGKRLAAISVDISEEMREREEQNLRQLLDNNRIVAAAVSHEIRNVCAAIGVVHSRLRQQAGLEENADFRALTGLVDALSGIAATELQTKSANSIGTVDLHDLLNQFRIVVEPDWKDVGGRIRWVVEPGLPAVSGEAFGVLQTLMNLSRNSLAAVRESTVKELEIQAHRDGPAHVLVEVLDSGPGIENPGPLFEAFRSGSGNTGLGLYVSRAIVRGYGGDLQYKPLNGRCRFVIELSARKATGR